MPSLARTIGRAMAGYLKAVGRHTEVAGAEAVDERLEDLRASGRRLVLGYWTEEILPLVLAACRSERGAGTKASNFEFVCDDSFGGRITAEVIERFERRARVIHSSQPAARMRDMQDIVRSTQSLGIAVDGTGPWGKVNPTLPRLIRRCGAIAVPIVAVGDFSFIHVRTHLAVPRPWGRIACAVGEPLDLAGDLDGADQEIASALERTRRLAWSTLGEKPPPARLMVAVR